MSLHADIVKILNSEGAASEGGWHSWRCFDKVRWPEPCECTEVVARMVMSAALDAAREAVDQLIEDDPDECHVCQGKQEALDAIDALKEKP